MGRVYNKDKEPKESSTKRLSKLHEKSFKIQKTKVRRSIDLNSSISSHSKSHNWSSLNDSVTLDDQLGGDERKAPQSRYVPATTSTEKYPRKFESSTSSTSSTRFLGIIKEEDGSEEEGEVKENKDEKDKKDKYSDEKDIEKKTKKFESQRRLRSPARRRDSSRDFDRWRNHRRRSQTDRRSGRPKPRPRREIREPIERWSKPQAVINPGPTVSSSRGFGAPRRTGDLRPITIDASNVAKAHGRDRYFSVEGILLVVRDFQERGHQVTAILPQHEKKHKHPRDLEELDRLYETDILKYVPSREFKGERINSHDDSYILTNAARTGAVVVTRDQFRDLTGKKKEWDEVIRNRLLAPFFAKDGQEDFLQWPDDPLGPSGPTLDDFLRF